jgi:MFS family permease
LLTLLIPLATPPYIGAILFLQAFFSSFFFPMAFVVVSKIIQKEDQSPALGFILFMGTLVGMGVLPKLLLDVAEVSGFSSGIIVMGLAVIVATIISVKISRTPPRVHASGNPTGLISR